MQQKHSDELMVTVEDYVNAETALHALVKAAAALGRRTFALGVNDSTDSINRLLDKNETTVIIPEVGTKLVSEVVQSYDHVKQNFIFLVKNWKSLTETHEREDKEVEEEENDDDDNDDEDDEDNGSRDLKQAHRGDI